MIRLFNSVYLDHIRHYHSRFPYMVASSVDTYHPASMFLKENIGNVMSFNQHIMETYGGDKEGFWNALLNEPMGQPFIIFADNQMFQTLLFTFWKSLFTRPSIKGLYQLYDLHRSEIQTKSFLNVDRGENLSGTYTEHFPPLDIREFEQKMVDSEESVTIRAMDKTNLGFAYLLGNYLAAPDSIYALEFIKRLKDVCWQRWFQELAEVKSQIAKNFFDIGKLFPELTDWHNRGLSANEVVESHPSLRWMQDKNFSAKNINYIIKTYDRKIFPELQSLCDKAFFVKLISEKISIDDFEVYNRSSRTEELFNHEYLKILELDIERGYGCFFLSMQTGAELGEYFVQNLYKLKRENRVDELQEYLLD